MDRRHVLKLIGAGCLSSFISPSKLFSKPVTGSSGLSPITFLTDKNLDPYRLTVKALELSGGIGKYINRGDNVVLKPNIAWDRTPAQAANTNPKVIEALVKECFKAGAKKVEVFDHTCNDPRRSYKRSGIQDAVKKAGGSIKFIDDRKFKEMNIKGELLKKWKVYAPAVECDKFINVPILKQHALGRLSIGMKNLMGIVADPRNSWHKNLDENLVDITGFLKQTLIIVDAYRALVRNGPTGGSPDDVKMFHTIISGEDPIGVDAQGAELMGIPPRSIEYIKLGDSKGLGSMKLSANRIIKDKKIENTSDK